MAGVLIAVPIGVAILILSWVFFTLDNFLQPVISSIAGRPIPGVGFVVTLLMVYLIGVIASNVAGRRFIAYGEWFLSKIPVFRYPYVGVKRILDSFAAPQKTNFMQVVLVEFPRKGMSSIGFITNETPGEPGNRLVSVFIPGSPNPTAGFLQIMMESEITRTDMSVQDALEMIVSAGRVLPKKVIEKMLKE